MLSSTEAEFIAGTEAAYELACIMHFFTYLSLFLADFGVHIASTPLAYMEITKVCGHSVRITSFILGQSTFMLVNTLLLIWSKMVFIPCIMYLLVLW